jgi:transposase-like protein
MKQIYVNGFFKGFNKLNTYSLLKDHPKRQVIEKRLKIIAFFERFGSEATKEAFNVSRSTVYLWKRKLSVANGRLTALAPLSKAPINRRQRKINPRAGLEKLDRDISGKAALK